MTNWHRLFGLFLMDLFTDSPFVVELEKDLSLKQQFLDVVIVRKNNNRPFDALPDGLDNLAEHNLLSYKSLHEPFDDWALKELTGHYVNYRKQVSPAPNRLLPERRFRLYGVSTRFPRKLSQQVPLTCLKPGIYEISRGTDTVRIIVLSEIVEGEHNAVWRLFSAKPRAVLQARQQYRVHRSDMSTIVQHLFEIYQSEKIDMPYTVQDYQKDYVRDHLDLLSPDEVLKRFSPDIVQRLFEVYQLEKIAMSYTVQDFQKDYVRDHLDLLSPDDRLRGLSPDEILKRFSSDDVLNNLSVADIEKLMEKLEKNFNSKK